jgi:hypothetical protein
MELTDLLTYAMGILLSVVGFILKSLWADIRENKDNMGKLKGKIELAEQKFTKDIDKLQHINSLKFLQIREKLDKMCKDIKEDLRKLSDEVRDLKK